MSIYVTNSEGKLKKVAGNSASIENSGGSSGGTAQSVGECLVADITFGSGTTCRLLEGLDLKRDGGIYEIIVELPVQTSKGTFSVDFGETNTVFSTALVLYNSTPSGASDILVSAIDYPIYGAFSTIFPTFLKLNVSTVNEQLQYDGFIDYFSAEDMIVHETFSGWGTTSDLTWFAMVFSSKISNCRMRVFKKPTNTPRITTGTSYSEPSDPF